MPQDEREAFIEKDQLKKITNTVYTTDLETITATKTSSGLTNYYFFDLASLFPVLALDIKGNDMVLDMCAAPGGKSLLLFSKLMESSLGEGQLLLNEKSLERFLRLRRTMLDFTVASPRLKLVNLDAKTLGITEIYQKRFDKILIDAPCSSERHVLQDETELNNWSEKRVKNLCMDQFTLICSGFDCLKEGGTLVYSTCAINKKENDNNIKRLFDKRKNQFQIINYCDSTLVEGEATEFGIQYLPDRSGFGPIYLAVIKKN